MSMMELRQLILSGRMMSTKSVLLNHKASKYDYLVVYRFYRPHLSEQKTSEEDLAQAYGF